MPEPDPAQKAQDDAAALKRAALDAAIKYHASANSHPQSKGAARPSTVTATASEFLVWLRGVAEEAGITDPDL